jgi:proteasome assembly chaperone (PAC2) family protein
LFVIPPHPHSLPIEGREAQVAMPVFIVSLPLVGRVAKLNA